MFSWFLFVKSWSLCKTRVFILGSLIKCYKLFGALLLEHSFLSHLETSFMVYFKDLRTYNCLINLISIILESIQATTSDLLFYFSLLETFTSCIYFLILFILLSICAIFSIFLSAIFDSLCRTFTRSARRFMRSPNFSLASFYFKFKRLVATFFLDLSINVSVSKSWVHWTCLYFLYCGSTSSYIRSLIDLMFSSS